MRPASRPPKLIEVYDDTEYACAKLTELLSKSVKWGAIGRGYPVHGMSARRLSIDRRMTLQSLGGPTGGTPTTAVLETDGAGEGSAETAGAVPVPSVLAGEGSGCVVEATTGGASFEHAGSVSNAGAMSKREAEAVQRSIEVLVTSTSGPWQVFPHGKQTRSSSTDHDSTEIWSFSRRAKYSSLML
jgi:hypothetical protein